VNCNISELVGKTLSKIEVDRNRDEIVFETADGQKYKMLHHDDFCESVTIEDIAGDLNDLIGSPITKAEESSNSQDAPKPGYVESYTWTYYEDVSFVKMDD
jgi:hypothetical protein